MGKGLTLSQIAKTRNVNLTTIKSEREAILNKLQARNANQALSLALAKGVITQQELNGNHED